MFNHVLCNHICPYLQTQSQKKNPISSRKSRPQDAEHGSHDRTQVVDCSWWTHLHWDAFEAFSDRMSQLMKPVGFPTPKLWDHGSLGSTLVHEVLFEKHIVVARWNMQLFCRDLEGGCRYEKLLLGVCTMTFDEKSYDFNVSRYWTVFSSLIATTKTTQNSEPLVFFFVTYHWINYHDFVVSSKKHVLLSIGQKYVNMFGRCFPNRVFPPVAERRTTHLINLIKMNPEKYSTHMGVSKNRGKTPKMDGLFHGKPYQQMDDLGGKPIFGNTHISTPFFDRFKKKHALPSGFARNVHLETARLVASQK